MELGEDVSFEDQGELFFRQIHQRVHYARALVDPVVVENIDATPLRQRPIEGFVEACAIEKVEAQWQGALSTFFDFDRSLFDATGQGDRIA